MVKLRNLTTLCTHVLNTSHTILKDVFGPRSCVCRRGYAESFVDWQSSSCNTINNTYRLDGQVVSTTVNGPALASPVTYNTWYDSLARTIEVEDGTSNVFWAPSAAASINPSYSSSSSSAYDALNRLGTFGSSSTIPTAGYWFDNGNGAAHFSYDSQSNLLNAYDSAVTPPSGTTTEMIAVTGMTYQGSKLTGYQDAVSGNGFQYSYDNSDRLSEASTTSTVAPALDGAVFQFYDQTTSFTQPGGGSLWNIQAVTDNVAHATASYSYGAASGASSQDQLSSISSQGGTQQVTYEQPPVSGSNVAGRGLVASYVDGSGTTWGYTYDEQMRLQGISQGLVVSEDIKYGAMEGLDERVFPGSASSQFRVGSDLTVAVSGTQAVATVHVRAGRRVVSITNPGTPTASLLYYHRDRQGTVIGTSLAGGVAGAKYRYDPYGLPLASSNATAANASELGYTGALVLSSGVLHLSARIYSPTLRRFLQPDNVDAKRYTYVEGDPVNGIDPTGHHIHTISRGRFEVPMGDDWVGMGTGLGVMQGAGGSGPSAQGQTSTDGDDDDDGADDGDAAPSDNAIACNGQCDSGTGAGTGSSITSSPGFQIGAGFGVAAAGVGLCLAFCDAAALALGGAVSLGAGGLAVAGTLLAVDYSGLEAAASGLAEEGAEYVSAFGEVVADEAESYIVTAADGSVTIFRGMSTAESSSLLAGNGFTSGAGQMIPKWFAGSAADAATWGSSGSSSGVVMSFQYPAQIMQEAIQFNANLDGIGPAWLFHPDTLNSYTPTMNVVLHF